MSVKNKYRTMYKLTNYLMVFALLSLGLLITSCKEQARGFALPEGNVENGKVTYTRLGCNECHSISEIEWKGGNDSLKIKLGGEVSIQKSYAELVTSVINPSHKIAWSHKSNASTEEGYSKMKNYNEIMTVQELIDIVSFLQSEYKVQTPPTYYPRYY